MSKLPTENDLAKLFKLAEQYGKASVAATEVYKAARVKHNDNDAHKLPEVRVTGETKMAKYRLMSAEHDAVNKKFPGLGLFCPAGFVGWTGKIDSYREHVQKCVKDLALKHWQEIAKDEVAAIREQLGPDVPAVQFKIGEYAFRPTGIVHVAKVFKRMAKGTNLNTEQPETMKGDYKRVSRELADRLMSLCKARVAYLKEQGIAA